jgi:hypothetical protein
VLGCGLGDVAVMEGNEVVERRKPKAKSSTSTTSSFFSSTTSAATVRALGLPPVSSVHAYTPLPISSTCTWKGGWETKGVLCGGLN